MTGAPSRLRGLAGLLGFVLATALIFKLIFALMDLRAGGAKDQLTIGSKADTEGILLAEILARRIERATGLTVQRRTALGGTQLCFQALLSGEIDMYPEYTGTALVALLERPAMVDPRQTFELVQRELLRRDELVLFTPFAFNNTYALAMAKAKAHALGVRRISDLAGHPQLSAGFTAEFMARQDGWPGLRERYQLAFRAQRTLEAGLMYRAAQQSEVDVISAYATDGRIEKFELVVLEDDQHFFPPYQAAPLVRRSTLAKHPALGRALEPLGGRLTDDEMRRLNAAVDIDRQRPEDVAEKYVESLDGERR